MEVELPEGLNVISDFIEERNMWLSGVYIGDYCCLVNAVHEDKSKSVELALEKFNTEKNKGTFNSLILISKEYKYGSIYSNDENA